MSAQKFVAVTDDLEEVHDGYCPVTGESMVYLATDYDALTARVASMQSRIDSLMIEFCPGEMTQEQRDEWARNQVRSPAADRGCHE